ncbi:MAG TPA: transporter [Verrucomicrobiae bacterium]|nr:transporter [Verrucomicrobiae bacterium]
MKRNIMVLIVAAAAAIFTFAHAGEIGHFNGGIMDIRDYFMPDPGIYGIVYNYYYFSDRLNNGNGDKISSVTVKTPGGPVPVNVNVDIDLYALIPAIIWISPYKILGGKFGGYIAPSFANDSLEADLSIANRAGGSVQNSSFGVGDLYVQPVWLGWAEKHWDFSLAYGFYAPVGKYNTRNVALPGGANVTVESKNNLGLGFWTQQVQAGIAWYPMTNKATAVTAVGTYEYNSEKEDFDIRPGQMFTVNWGVSQYLPLRKNHELLLEVGPAGYDSYQITDSTGGNALTDTPKSRVHAAGGQLGLVYVPWNAFLTFHGFCEYSAISRFQGASIGINLGIKF